MKIPATILAVRQATPTIKTFTLDLLGQEFSFFAGQWVDCYVEIDGRVEVAGYSMTSSPLSTETIDLAVKRVGVNRVTHYLHERAWVGMLLHIDGGQGDFCYHRGMGDSLVLIGGGIGLTPLMSIMRYVDEAAPEVKATLLYSATKPSELLFREELDDIASDNRRLRCLFTVTQPRGESWDGHVGRVDSEWLRESRIDLGALFYVCGPQPMIEDMVGLLRGLGAPSSSINYEGW